MKNRSLAWMCLGAILAAMLACLLYYCPRLPETVASHFDIHGDADGWSDKRSFILVIMGLNGFLLLVFLPTILFLPRIPHSMINLPHKDYWLAPDRAEDTFRGVGTSLLWFANWTLLFMLSIMLLTFRANLRADPSLSNWFWVWLGVYLVYVMGWSIAILIRYGKRLPTADP